MKKAEISALHKTLSAERRLLLTKRCSQRTIKITHRATRSAPLF